jgi:translin
VNERSSELARVGDEVLAALEAAHRAREDGLANCRLTISACGRAIRAIHRKEATRFATLVDEARTALNRAQAALQPFPRIAFAGFLHDAEKEYAEAMLTAALVDGRPLPSALELGVELPAWLNGLAEAASELRRHLLDRLREGQLERAERLLGAMEDVYDLLVTVDYPDAITGGLRRATDALRGVVERSRGDLTSALLHHRVQAALKARLDQPEP